MAGARMGVPTREQLSSYVVNREGWEGIRQSLYDSAAYQAAGVTQLTFFQLPIGQSGKTLSDTNMTLAGQMPANQEFLVEEIQISLFTATPTVAAGMPAVFGAQLAATSVNDAYIFYRSGNLVLTIGSKPYLQEAPLIKFPPMQNFDVEGALADTTTAAAASQSRLSFAKAIGRPYKIVPLLLTSNQNFNVTLNWPEGVQAITNPARVVVSMDGVLYRRSQ